MWDWRECAHHMPLKQELRRRNSWTNERLADRRWEYVIEIEMQLRNYPDPAPAVTIDRDDRFDADLKIIADPDHAGVDGASGPKGHAEIVGHRRLKLRFDDRDEVIDEVRQLEIDNVRM